MVRFAELQQKIYSLKQDNRAITEFFSQLKILWEELEMYMHIPHCRCRIRYSCDVMRSARSNHNMLYVIRFFIGLNEEFNVVKSQILLLDSLPTLNKIFSMVIQHERYITPIPVHVDDESNVLINVVGQRKPSFKKFRLKIYTFYGKSGHTIDTCYCKHGVPPHLQRNSNSNAHNANADNPDNSNFETPCDVQSPRQHIAEQYQTLISILQNSNVNK